MAVTVTKKLDAHLVRADFPIFEQEIHGKPLAFLDSAASAQKPRQMMEAMTAFYSTSYANVHRGVYVLAERATAALEGAREKVRALVNARDAREIIFVRNATEAINLVAYSWGLANLGPGDLVVVTELEHHSNFVPWQYIAGRTGAELAMIPLTDEGELDLSTLPAIAAQGNIKVVATNQVSNSLGTINPIK
jgi:cysteine desulfurase/selenocysteine lyase